MTATVEGPATLSADTPVSGMQGVVLALLNELVPGAIAVLALAATSYIAIQGHQVPDVLSNMDFAIIAFYFGARSRGPVAIRS